MAWRDARDRSIGKDRQARIIYQFEGDFIVFQNRTRVFARLGVYVGTRIAAQGRISRRADICAFIVMLGYLIIRARHHPQRESSNDAQFYYLMHFFIPEIDTLENSKASLAEIEGKLKFS